MKTFFNRKQQKKVDLKAFPLPTVSTLLIPKELLPALDKICFVGYNPKTNKKMYDLRTGLHLLLSKYRGFLLWEICRLLLSPSLSKHGC